MISFNVQVESLNDKKISNSTPNGQIQVCSDVDRLGPPHKFLRTFYSLYNMLLYFLFVFYSVYVHPCWRCILCISQSQVGRSGYEQFHFTLFYLKQVALLRQWKREVNKKIGRHRWSTVHSNLHVTLGSFYFYYYSIKRQITSTVWCCQVFALRNCKVTRATSKYWSLVCAFDVHPLKKLQLNAMSMHHDVNVKSVLWHLKIAKVHLLIEVVLNFNWFSGLTDHLRKNTSPACQNLK